MTVYVLMVTNKLTQSEYVDSIYESEDDALDQAEIIKGQLENRFQTRVEAQRIIEIDMETFND